MVLGENYLNFSTEERVNSYPYQVFIPQNPQHTLDEIHVNLKRVEGSDETMTVPIYRIGDMGYELVAGKLGLRDDRYLTEGTTSASLTEAHNNYLARGTYNTTGFGTLDWSPYGLVDKALRSGSTIAVTARITGGPEIGEFQIEVANVDGADAQILSNSINVSAASAVVAVDMGIVTLTQDWDGIIWRFRRTDGTELISIYEVIFEIDAVPHGSISMSIHELDENGIPYPMPIDNGVSVNSIDVASLGTVFSIEVFEFTNCYIDNKTYAIRFNTNANGWFRDVDYVSFGASEVSEVDRFAPSLQFLGKNNQLSVSPIFLSADIYYTSVAKPAPEFVWPCTFSEQKTAMMSFIALVQSKLDTIFSLSLKPIVIYSDSEPKEVSMWEDEWVANGYELPISNEGILLWFNTLLDTFGGSYRIVNNELVHESHPVIRGGTIAANNITAGFSKYVTTALKGAEFRVYLYIGGTSSAPINPITIGSPDWALASNAHSSVAANGYEQTGDAGTVIDVLNTSFAYSGFSKINGLERLIPLKFIALSMANTVSNVQQREDVSVWYRQ